MNVNYVVNKYNSDVKKANNQKKPKPFTYSTEF